MFYTLKRRANQLGQWWPVSRCERHNFAWHGRRGGRDYRFIDLIFPTGPVVEVSAFVGR